MHCGIIVKLAVILTTQTTLTFTISCDVITNQCRSSLYVLLFATCYMLRGSVLIGLLFEKVIEAVVSGNQWQVAWRRMDMEKLRITVAEKCRTRHYFND